MDWTVERGVIYQNIARRKHKFVHYRWQSAPLSMHEQNVVAEGQVHFQEHLDGNISSSNSTLFASSTITFFFFFYNNH